MIIIDTNESISLNDLLTDYVSKEINQVILNSNSIIIRCQWWPSAIDWRKCEVKKMGELNKIIGEIQNDFKKEMREKNKRHQEVKQGERKLVLTINRYKELSVYPFGDSIIKEGKYSTVQKVRVLTKKETAEIQAIITEQAKLRTKRQTLLKKYSEVRKWNT